MPVLSTGCHDILLELKVVLSAIQPDDAESHI